MNIEYSADGAVFNDRGARITFFENYFYSGNNREPNADQGWIHMVTICVNLGRNARRGHIRTG